MVCFCHVSFSCSKYIRNRAHNHDLPTYTLPSFPVFCHDMVSGQVLGASGYAMLAEYLFLVLRPNPLLLRLVHFVRLERRIRDHEIPRNCSERPPPLPIAVASTLFS